MPRSAIGAWGIQVGAFANLATAQAAADHARAALPMLLRRTKVELPATAPFGSKVAFRARLVGLLRQTQRMPATAKRARATLHDGAAGKEPLLGTPY